MRHTIDIDDAIRRECRSRGYDAATAALAGSQNGVVTRPQLIALGMHPRAIDRRIATGRLHVLYPGVYAVGDRCLPVLGRLHAAVLAVGGVASGRSAAALHGVRAYDGWPEVTAPPGARSRSGIRVTRSTLEADEVTLVRGIPATT